MHVRKLMSSTLIFCCDASSTRYMTSWPTLLPEPWTSLEELHLCFWANNPKIFKDVDLHMSFPNLTLLNMGVKGYRSDPFMLPDLSGCERLESITLEPLHVSFQSDLKEKVTEITLHGEYLPLVIYSAIQNKKLISKVVFFISWLTEVPLPPGLKKIHLMNCTFVGYGTRKTLDMDDEVIGPIKKHLKGG